MALQRGKLADIQYIGSSAGSIYANPSSSKTYVRAFTLFNGNTTTEKVKLYNVPDSAGSLGAAGDANQFLEVDLATKETLFVELNYPIVLTAENDSIQADTDTSSKVTVMLHGDIDA